MSEAEITPTTHTVSSYYVTTVVQIAAATRTLTTMTAVEARAEFERWLQSNNREEYLRGYRAGASSITGADCE